MTLYNSHNNFSEWRGEPINDVRHPYTIEYLWSDAELQEIGLYKPHMIVDQPIPEGKISTHKEVQIIEGVPTWVHTLIDVSVVEPQLNLNNLEPYQFWAMMKISGHEQDVHDLVASLPQPDRAIGEAILQYSKHYERNHALVEQIRQGLGMTNEELDILWDQATSI